VASPVQPGTGDSLIIGLTRGSEIIIPFGKLTILD